MTDLKVPLALDARRALVDAEVATLERGPFLCPSCRMEVTLKRGPVKVAHFAHKPDTDCTGESIEHATAKLLLIRHLESLAGRSERRVLAFSACIGLSFENRAESCECEVDYVVKLPPFTDVALEHQLFDIPERKAEAVGKARRSG